MKIIYDAQIFRRQRYGGISRYFCEVAARASRTAGVTARILAPNHLNEYLQHVPAGTLLGWQTPESKPMDTLARLGGRVLVRGAMTTLAPEILHETYYSDSWAIPSKTARVLTIYDMIHERFANEFGPGDPTAEFKRKAVQRADHIVCISEATRRDVMEILGVSASRLSVIHLAAHLKPTAMEAGVSGPPYLLYVGQRGGYKNFMGLVAAMAASSMLRNLQVVCFGGGPLSAAEWEQVDAFGLPREKVVMRSGGDETLAALYAGALCFVYPSQYEGFGIPPLEAMLCQCPVACSNTSSIPEVVRDAGTYFDPSSIESIRLCLEQLVSSPSLQNDLRQRGQALVSRYSWERCTEEHLSLYRQINPRSLAHA